MTTPTAESQADQQIAKIQTLTAGEVVGWAQQMKTRPAYPGETAALLRKAKELGVRLG